MQFAALEEDRRFGRWIKVNIEGKDPVFFNKMLNVTKKELEEADYPYILRELMPPLDPYNNDLFMPLMEYAAHDAAYELLHNGQTLQVRYHLALTTMGSGRAHNM